MSVVGLLALLAVGEGAAVIDVCPRQPVQVAIWSPDASRGRVRHSELLDALAQAMTDATRLELRPIDVDLRGCEGRPSCQIQRARSADGDVRYLFLLTVQSSDGQPDLLFPMLVDVARAADALAAGRAEGSSADALDVRLETEGVVVRAPSETVDERTPLAAWATSTLSAMREDLVAHELWATFGRLEITAPTGLSIELDERIVGLTGPRAILESVDAGAHTVALVGARGDRATYTVDVGATGTTTLEVRSTSAPLLTVPRVAAAALVAIGGGLMVAGAVTVDDATPLRCGGGPPLTCGAPTFERLGGGPLTIPLGYSVGAAGVTALVGGLWAEDAPFDEAWWLVIGGVVGAVAYGVSEAAN